jgi:hypothetical protein
MGNDIKLNGEINLIGRIGGTMSPTFVSVSNFSGRRKKKEARETRLCNHGDGKKHALQSEVSCKSQIGIKKGTKF